MNKNINSTVMNEKEEHKRIRTLMRINKNGQCSL